MKKLFVIPLEDYTLAFFDNGTYSMAEDGSFCTNWKYMEYPVDAVVALDRRGREHIMRVEIQRAYKKYIDEEVDNILLP